MSGISQSRSKSGRAEPGEPSLRNDEYNGPISCIWGCQAASSINKWCAPEHRVLLPSVLAKGSNLDTISTARPWVEGSASVSAELP